MSNIISTDIDESYPVAGQDNDSQGFRDNFAVIKNSLATARSEITTLEDNTAKKVEDNDFHNNEIQRAVLVQTTEKVLSTAAGSSQTLHWTYGPYQDITVSDDLTLTLTSWPEAGTVGKLRVVVRGDGVKDHTITFLTTLGNNILKNSTFTNPFDALSTEAPKVFDFWTIDGGETVFGHYLGEFVL